MTRKLVRSIARGAAPAAALMALASLATLAGCDGSSGSKASGQPKAASAPQPDIPVVVGGHAPPPPAPPPPKMVREQAQVGVGEKGRGYSPGLVTTPIAAYFATKERISFEIQIPHAMQLYEALNGHAPQTQEEFMEKIIQENAIPLPQLPPRHRYVYDPESKQLMVEHPE